VIERNKPFIVEGGEHASSISAMGPRVIPSNSGEASKRIGLASSEGRKQRVGPTASRKEGSLGQTNGEEKSSKRNRCQK